MAALIGYGRTSTADQVAGLEGQERDLKAAGCAKLFLERVSATAARRPQLEAALDWARDGDTLIVTKPDRMARSTADLLGIVARLEAKGVGLVVLSMGGQPLDTRTPTGRLLLTMMAAVAEFEKALMLERQREGIAKAKAEGKYQGRPPTALRQAGEVARLKADGVAPTEIARRLGMSRMSVYRALKAAGVGIAEATE
jgi:DNA invertase Pin-like site-specific DNA recombinase